MMRTMAIGLAVSGLMAAAAPAADRSAAVAEAGRLTGLGLHCGYGAEAEPLKAALVALGRDSRADPATLAAWRDAHATASSDAYLDARRLGAACPDRGAYARLVAAAAAGLAP
jgi:hypothetical protein